MAKRMKSKIQPAELKIALQMRSSGYHYVDLSQCASIINRRFYRQGLNWAVSHFTFYKTAATETGSQGVSVSKLPTSWVMSNAWEKGFRSWQEMNKKAVEDSDQESLKGKFLDFKIFMNEGHFDAGSSANLLPIDVAGNVATAGEWIMSDIVVPLTNAPGTGTQFEIMALGPNFGTGGAKSVVSLINGYANSRALPNISDPNTPGDSTDASGATPENWLAAMFNEGTTQDSAVIQNMTAYDEAPYPYENDGTHTDTMYPGGQTQLPASRVVGAAYFNAGTNANKVVIEGDTFPCGLVELYSSSDDNVSVIVHMVPGNHRGYLAESMTEM